ncbi:MAG TPA: ABC transporter permease [Bacillota bacterium]|jgi:ABC-type nitrate/sulfonate/bicarbonate transport system permease component
MTIDEETLISSPLPNGRPWRPWLLRAAALVSFVGLWQLAASLRLVNPVFLPAPSTIAQAFADAIRDGAIFVNSLISLRRVILGFAAGAVLAVPLGLAMGHYRDVEHFFDPLIELLRPIPPLAWIPLSIIWLGIEESPKIFIIFLGAFFPILLATVAGVKNVDPILARAARSLGAGGRDIYLRVVLPAAVPSILTGLRVGLGVAWTCLVAAELIAARAGLGYMIAAARRYLVTEVVIMGMLVIGLLGVLMEVALRAVERRITFWVEK